MDIFGPLGTLIHYLQYILIIVLTQLRNSQNLFEFVNNSSNFGRLTYPWWFILYLEDFFYIASETQIDRRWKTGNSS